jgi:transcription elongation factor Elf1
MKYVPMTFFKLSKRYFISCNNCGEEIELEYWEYLKLKGI